MSEPDGEREIRARLNGEMPSTAQDVPDDIEWLLARLQHYRERVEELEGVMAPFFEGEDSYAGSLAQKVVRLVESEGDELSAAIIRARLEDARRALDRSEGGD